MFRRDPDPNPLILIRFEKPLPNKARLSIRFSLPRYSLWFLAFAAGLPVTPELLRWIGRFL